MTTRSACWWGRTRGAQPATLRSHAGLAAALAWWSLTAFAGPAMAQPICTVPGNFATIAAALANPACSTIDLTAPTYNEAVVIERDVTLRGRGPTRTTLYGRAADGTAFDTSVVTVHNGRTVLLQDLAVRDGRAPNGGGITNDGGQLTLLRCRVEGNEATDLIGEGGGILNRSGGGLVLIETTVRKNKARLNGGGISSSGLAVPVLSDPAARQAIADAYTKLRSVRIPDYSPFPTPESLLAIGEAFIGVSKEVVGAVVDLLGKGFGNLIDGAAPANRTRTALIETGLTALAIADSVIEENVVETGTASAWGGGIHVDQGLVLIENTRIVNNRAKGRIGAFGGGVSAGLSFTLIRNSEVVHNEALSETIVSGGGAVWNLAGALEVHDSRLEDNAALSFFHNNGGGIHNMGGLVRVYRSTLERNKSGNGGGIANQYMGNLTVEDSSIRDNEVDGIVSAFGGGIKNEKGSTATIRRSAITGNIIRGRSRGGGIYNESEAEVYETSVGGQKVFLPLWNTTRVTVENSTISGNTIDGRKTVPKPFALTDCIKELEANLNLFPTLWQQSYARYEDCKVNGFGETLTLHLPARGAAIYTGSQSLGLAYTTVRNSTIAFNRSEGNDAHGGGLYASMASGINVVSAGLITDVSVESSLVTNNTPTDCARFIYSASPSFNATRANLDTDGTCRALDGDFTTLDPQLLPLGRNGGSTVTHALPTTSPAKDQTAGCPATDQRGESRALGGPCDIGAFELTPPRGVADAYSGEEDRPIVAAGERNLLANDMGIGLGAAVVDAAPQHGTVVLLPNGDFTYTPNPDFFGPDEFTYRAADASGTTIGPIPVAIEISGRLDVSDVSPAAESIGVARQPIITVTFDDPMTLAGVAGRVFLYGDRSKLTPSTAVPATQLTVDGNVVTITPPYDFALGERITLVLSDLVESSLDVRLAEPLVTQMVVRTDDGGGGFAGFELGSLIGHKIVLGDLDGDGDLDAVLASEFTDVWTRVWINTGNGFAPGQTLTFEHRTLGTRHFRASGLALADLDGDGDLDLITTTRDIDQITTSGRGGIHTRVWFNDGNGTFTASNQDFLSATYPDPSSPILQDPLGGTRALWTNTAAHRAVALGDLDGDGDIDAFIVAGQGRRGSFGTGDGSPVRFDSVWFNDGGGTFTRGGLVGAQFGEAVALGDVDGDGDLDAIVANSGDQSRVWLNDGRGNFSGGQQFPSGTDVKVADFNGDGNLDLAFAADGVWLGDGNGGFARAPNQPQVAGMQALDVGDLDGDGDLDLFIAAGSRFEYFDINGISDQVWINDGQGNFTTTRQVFPETFSASLALGDIDQDGTLDAFIVKIGSQIETVDGFDWDRAVAAPAEIWYGLRRPETSPDTYTVAEDSQLERQAANGVLANDAAPGAQAKHPFRIDTHRAPSGTLGGLWIYLDEVLGFSPAEFQTVDFDRDEIGWYASQRVILGQPQHGTVALAPDGSFTYAPDPDFFGTDSFQYYAEAPAADSTPPETVTVHVTPVNDAPVANDDVYPFDSGGVIVAAPEGVLANDFDADGDALSAVLVTQATRGIVTLNANGGFVYIPGPVQTGGDVFTYRAVDPSGAQSSPARVKLGNSPPSGPPLRIYPPNPDGSLSVPAGDGLLVDAIDPDGDELSIHVSVPPRHGSVVVQPDGSFAYTPGPQGPSADVFVYVLSDGIATSPPIRVKIGNTAPVARDDRFVTATDTLLSRPAPGILANDTDADADPLTASLVSPPASGSLQLDADGSFVFTPAAGFVGDVTFTYLASDGIASSQATVTLVVASELRIISRDPAANAVGVPIDSDVAVTFDVSVKPATALGRLRVVGAQRGSYEPVVTTLGSVVTAAPALDFLPGERITVTALEGIEGGTNARLARAHSWRFDAATAAASGQLEDDAQVLGNSVAQSVALGDIDGDGDLDAFVVTGLTGSSALWLNDGNGSFSPHPTQDLAGRRASSIALGDLDGDGDLDAFIAGISHGTFPVFNTGGVFDWPAFTLTSDSVVQNGKLVELADLDGDGDLDAVLATADTFSIVTALNDGSGHFTVVSQIEAGDVRSLSLGDLDGDGIIDLVAGTQAGVRAWLGDGLGAFPTALDVQSNGTLGLLTQSVDLGDLDGDGDLDVIAGGFYRRVYFNDGNGNLSEGPILYTGPAAQVRLGDFDGDGDLDVFIATGRKLDEGFRPHEVWLNDGSGSFAEAPRAPTHGAATVAVALGDLDGDGDLDVFTGTYENLFGPSPDRVLLNRTTASGSPAGRFVDSEQRFSNEASVSVALADFDGDGHLDVYVINDDREFSNPAPDELWINDGAGNLSPSPFGAPNYRRYGGTVGDLNGDGFPDLILIGIPTQVYLNNGQGRLDLLGPALEVAIGGDIYLADLDGDGDLDAIQIRNTVSEPFTTWLNDGAGNFTRSEILTPPGDGSFTITIRAVAVFDADGDGDLDMYTVENSGLHRLWRNDGTGKFPSSATTSYPGDFRTRVSAADIDGDGDIDLLLGSISSAARLRLNDGTGTFSYGQTFNARTAGLFSTLADVNADGHPDAVFGRNNEPAEFWINDGLGNFTFEDGVIGTGQTLAIAFGDLDGDGDLDAFVGQGNVSGLTIVQAPNEVWFNTTLNPALGLNGAAPHAIGDDETLFPFANVIVTAPAGKQVSVRLHADTIAPGSLDAASLASAGFQMEAANDWTLPGTSSGAATAALRALRFDPVSNRLPVGMLDTVQLSLRVGTDDDSLLDESTVITIVSINDVPVAGPAPALQVAEESQIELAAPGLLAGAIDPDVGDSLSVILLSEPAAGDIAVLPNGSLLFLAGSAPAGPMSFTYQISDGRSASPPVVATIMVTEINRAPMALPDTYTVDEDTELVVSAPGVLANDGDPNGDAIQAVLVSAGQGEVILQPNGGFTYKPADNFFGTDTFLYSAFDGQLTSQAVVVTIHVQPINDTPVAEPDAYTTETDIPLTIPAPGVLANDLDADDDPLQAVLEQAPARGTLTLGSDGSIHYIPEKGFHGAVEFTYRASDGTAVSAAETVTITVGRAEGQVNAEIDFYFVNRNEVLLVPAPGVLDNDQDPDNDALEAVELTSPSHGNLDLSADGSFTYTPDADFFGVDIFFYTSLSSTRSSDPVPVIVVVDINNTAPVAVNDPYEAEQDTPLVVPDPGVLSNDTDADDDTLTAEWLSGPEHGVLVLNADGGFTYTPDTGYWGPDSFTYRAYDGIEYSEPATVSLTVNEFTCGDAELQGPEQCDDGNVEDGDGCTSECRLQPEMTVAGSGAKASNCIHRWLVMPQPTRGTVVRCTDGDPSCDAGPAGDGICHFRVAMCFNVDDGSGTCTAKEVRELRILAPRDKPRDEADAGNRQALDDALLGLNTRVRGTCQRGAHRFLACERNSDCDSRGGSGDGVCQRTAVFQPALGRANQCTPSALVEVPARGSGVGVSRVRRTFRVQALSVDPHTRVAQRPDVDALTLRCDR